MTLREFEAMVDKTLKSLPQEFQDILKIKQVGVVVRARMPAAVKKEYKGQPVFGMFIGVPFGHIVLAPTEPTRMEFYKESFDQFENEQEMRQEIAKTVIHEVGHYFGFSDKQLKDLHLE